MIPGSRDSFYRKAIVVLAETGIRQGITTGYGLLVPRDIQLEGEVLSGQERLQRAVIVWSEINRTNIRIFGFLSGYPKLAKPIPGEFILNTLLVVFLP